MSKLKDFFQSKNKTAKFLSFFFTGFLFVGSLGATAGACYVASQNFEEGSDFSKSYNLRYELDLTRTEDPNVDVTPPASVEELQEKLDTCVDSYAKYLNDKGMSVFNIYPEAYYDKPNNEFKAFINVVVPNVMIADPDDADSKDKVGKDQTEIYFDDVYASRLSMFYHDSDISKRNFVITRNDIVNNGKAFSLPESSYENALYIHLQNHSENNFLKNIKQTFKDSQPSKDSNDDATTEQPYMYIINDQQGLINRLEYLLKVGYLKISSDFYLKLYNHLSSSEQQFITDWNSAFGLNDKTEIEDLNGVINGSSAFLPSSSSFGSGKTLENGSIFTDLWSNNENKYVNFIEEIDGATQKDKYSTHKGTIKYSFMSKWIIGIVTNSSDGESGYLKYFPDKNPTKTSKDSNDEWISINAPGTTRFDTELIKKQFASYNFAYPIKNITSNDKYNSHGWIASLTGRDESGTAFNDEKTAIVAISTSLFKNVLGNSPLLSSIIVYVVVSILVGIIVSILYKIPGLISFGLMSLASSLTSLFAFMGGYQFSVALMVGLLSIVVLGTFTLINYFERLKKQIAMTYDMMVSVKRAFLSSIMSCIDLHVIVLLVGVVLVYFGPATLLAAGVALVIGSLLSFVINFLLLAGLMWLMFGNQSNAKCFNLFVYRKKKLLDDFSKQSESTPNLNKMTFFGNKPLPNVKVGKKEFATANNLLRTNIFGWKGIVYSVCFLAIAIIGLSLLFTVGVHNSYSFYGGTRVVIFIGDVSGFNYDYFISQLKSLGVASWYNVSLDGNYVYLYTSSTLTHAEIVNAITSIIIDPDTSSTIDASNIMFGSITNDAIMNFVHTDIKLLLIASGFISIYAFVRLGWTSIIGVFFGIVAGPLLTISLLSICQIYFDTYIVYAAILIYIVNALLVFNIAANVNNMWLKQNVFDYKSIKKAINTQLENHFTYYFIVLGIGIGMIIASIILGSTTLIPFAYITLIGFLVSLVVAKVIAPMFCAFFLAIKHKYLKNLTARSLTQKNYDTIDEELIDGVNKVKKQRTYL